MPVQPQLLEEIREDYPSSSWAIWSDAFPDDDCPESDRDRRVAFIESQHDRLNRRVVFVSLNPSAELPRNYANFHSPKGKHYDNRLKRFIQENDLAHLTGGFMTDIVPDVVNPDSQNVTPEDADVDRFLDQLALFDESEHHVIAFTGSTFDAIQGYFDEPVTTDEHDIQRFTATDNRTMLHVYRVWFYGNYGANQDKVQALERQLEYLDQLIDEG